MYIYLVWVCVCGTLSSERFMNNILRSMGLLGHWAPVASHLERCVAEVQAAVKLSADAQKTMMRHFSSRKFQILG